MGQTEPGPCGSWRVLAYERGNPSDTRWCPRVEGPCPYPETDRQPGSERRCATEPGTVLRVHWADEVIEDALKGFQTFISGGGRPTEQDYHVAVDALRACGAGETP